MEQIIASKLNNFFTQFTHQSFSKNEIILRPDGDDPYIFFLKSGLVRMYVITEEGLEVAVHLFRPDSFFPIMLSLNNEPNKYYFEAMDDVGVIKAPAQKVIKFVKSEPDVLYNLTLRFASAITGLMLRIEQLVAQGAYSKIISLLLYLSQVQGENKKNKIIINLKYSHDDIAAWVGVARETVSRQMEKLEKKGLIKQDNHHIVIENMEKLKQEIS